MGSSFIRYALAILITFLQACGGGGGGGGGGSSSNGVASGSTAAAPYISAILISFSTVNVPAGFLPSGSPSGSNTVVEVSVEDNSSGAPITGASVSLNGVALSYIPADQTYQGGITVAPGQSVNLSVTVNGNTYTASGTQFTSYPTISSPLSGATWSSLTSNLVSWSAAPPTLSSYYALGVLDTSGQLVWPSSSLQTQPTSTTSATISPSNLTAGSRLVIVGLADTVSIPNAAANSGIIIGGFNYVPITVTSSPTLSLVSIAVTPNNPTTTSGKTRQLTATGTYSDSSTRDLTTQVAWSSTDGTKVIVSNTGVVTGVGYGSATITATLGSTFGSAPVNVFQPTPSPSTPLSQAVAYQIDYAHSGRAVFSNPLTYPGSSTWSVTLDGQVSYPLIAGGKVFVTTLRLGTTSSSLYALNEQTGAISWGPIAISGTFGWSSHAYDHGKVFVINYDGLLKSFDANTGTVGWSTQLPGQYAFSSPPTAVNGIIYVGGAGVGGTLYAVDESNGNLLWTASVWNGDGSSPAVSSDGVFVSYPCQVYKFDPITGVPIWHYSGGCEGGGGKTPAYANGRLYVRDPGQGGGEIFDASVGTIVGNFTASPGTPTQTPAPAFLTQTGFFQIAGTLKGIDLTSNNVLWSFTGDGSLVSAPIVINQTVFVGSSSGNVYAVDSTTGAQLWSGYAGSAISGPIEQNLTNLPDFGAGEGYLIVPAGDRLTAWKLF